jgi:hypothetical protein
MALTNVVEEEHARRCVHNKRQTMESHSSNGLVTLMEDHGSTGQRKASQYPFLYLLAQHNASDVWAHTATPSSNFFLLLWDASFKVQLGRRI